MTWDQTQHSFEAYLGLALSIRRQAHRHRRLRDMVTFRGLMRETRLPLIMARNWYDAKKTTVGDVKW